MKPFDVVRGKVTFLRLSPNGMNGVKQKKIGGASHHAPERYGLWVFGHGGTEMFYAWSAFKARLPKGEYQSRFLNAEGDWDESSELAEKRWLRSYYRDLLREIQWAGPVYSCIDANGQVTRHPDFGGEWSFHESAAAWAKAARKCYVSELADGMVRYGEKRPSYGYDHYECFLPGKKFD